MLLTIDAPETLQLQRYPRTRDKSLRAWSAADEILLKHLRESQLQAGEKLLVLNDQFGAITCALADWSPCYWSDSRQSQIAISDNLTRQEKNAQAYALDFSLDDDLQLTTSNNFSKHFDRVLVRIPKHNSWLKFQLQQIKPWLTEDCQIIAAGMSKDIHKSTLKIFEECLGATTTSLAVKKARLIFSTFENNSKPQTDLKHFSLKDVGLKIYGLPGVFSRESLDIGARVMLNHLPKLDASSRVLDLGCGNAVLAAAMASQQPQAKFILVDESRMAIESARLTFEKNQLGHFECFHADVLRDVSASSFSHVVCNPPFHQQNVQTLAIAHKMFRSAAQHLIPDGELRVVANRHLPYLRDLKKYFNDVKSISADSKFTVWVARLPKPQNTPSSQSRSKPVKNLSVKNQ